MALYYEDPEQLREANSYISQLRAQDDRSCVIMIAARIHFLLESSIERRLIEPQSRRRKGMVGNLANAIDLSYRLGILHARHAEALHALRRIRNGAAHFDKPMSLEDERQDVEAFCRPWLEGRAGETFRPYLEREREQASGPARGRFFGAAAAFFVFFSPLPTIVPRLEPLSWLRGIDDG